MSDQESIETAEQSSHGYLRGDALRAKIDEINRLAPDYLWVGLGVPYEQAFVDEFLPRLCDVGVI
jgi:N-acetylglucosaminyldiphosphoundecaprenol N-acetyl-beta-D-mannosaminyltransferase